MSTNEKEFLARLLKSVKIRRLEDLDGDESCFISSRELESLLREGRIYLTPSRYDYLLQTFSIPFAFYINRVDFLQIIMKYGGETTLKGNMAAYMDIHYQKYFGIYPGYSGVSSRLPKEYPRLRFYLTFLLFAAFSEGTRDRHRRLEVVLSLWKCSNLELVSKEEFERVLISVSEQKYHERIRFVAQKLSHYFSKKTEPSSRMEPPTLRYLANERVRNLVFSQITACPMEKVLPKYCQSKL